MKKLILLCLFLLSFPFSKALTLDEVFQANDATSLKQLIEKNQQKLFLQDLCEKQKLNQSPPTACYELSLAADVWCLNLELKVLDLKILNKSLKSPFLSAICRDHLKTKQKILNYRKKDFLIPELKNYWTSEKTIL